MALALVFGIGIGSGRYFLPPPLLLLALVYSSFENYELRELVCCLPGNVWLERESERKGMVGLGLLCWRADMH